MSQSGAELVFIKKRFLRLGVVTSVCNRSIWEVEALGEIRSRSYLVI